MTRKTRLLAIAAVAMLPLFLAAACGSSPTTPKPPVEEPPVEEPPPPPPPKPTLSVTRILAFGDSLTEGESLGQLLWADPYTSHKHNTPGVATSYPYKLQEILDEVYGEGKVQVFNGGKGGERALDSRTKERLISEIALYKPQVVLIMHGANDLVGAIDNAGGDASSANILLAVDAVEELVELAKVQTGKPHVMLASLPPEIETSKARGARLVTDFNEYMEDVAREEGATFVDIYAAVTTSMLMPDGLHVTESGNEKIAQTFYAAIKKKYHKDAPTTVR